MTDLKPGTLVLVRSDGTGKTLLGIFLGSNPHTEDPTTYSYVWWPDGGRGTVDHSSCSPWIAERREAND